MKLDRETLKQIILEEIQSLDEALPEGAPEWMQKAYAKNKAGQASITAAGPDEKIINTLLKLKKTRPEIYKRVLAKRSNKAELEQAIAQREKQEGGAGPVNKMPVMQALNKALTPVFGQSTKLIISKLDLTDNEIKALLMQLKR